MNSATQILQDPRYDLKNPQVFPADLEPLVDLSAMKFVWNRITRFVPCKDGSYFDLDDLFIPCPMAGDDEQINNENGHSIYWYVNSNPALSGWCLEDSWTSDVGLVADPEIYISIEAFYTQGALDLIYEDPLDNSIHSTLDEALEDVLQGPDRERWLELKKYIESDPLLEGKILNKCDIEYPEEENTDV